ncbi:winged helix DNA-binding domain-containing protein [Streptomyces albidoflavus]
MTSPPPPLLTPQALNRATLARQHLLERTPLTPVDAVRHLVGLQAQNTVPPYLALAARLDGFDPYALSAAMEARQVVRIVSMRSTLHTLTAADARALLPLVQPARDRELRVFRSRLAGAEPERVAARARGLVEEEPRTMAELRRLLAPAWPEADPAALAVAARCVLPLVQVTPRGLWGRSGQVALTTLDHWLGDRADPRDGPADLAGLVRRYLAAFGPASVRDVQQWSGLTRLRPHLEALRPELAVFRDEHGTELFDLPDAPRPGPEVPVPPRLLPEFDNLLLSHADRTRVLPDAHRPRLWTGNQSHPVLLLDGRTAGLWHHTREGARATLTVRPFAPDADLTGVPEEARRLLALLHPEATEHEVVTEPA